ncbi:unnamed protein product [Tuber melanosporum]|uniref:(Perigord truffle) hypothetical protein n=1 Tax=Tuber melanosporum (strain Mel28) TaxID=656061 RepID=D5GJT2_TUBMM|nr:uncharacterized protein GSTUM_00009181001 [Tuber melanosporum]CAZ84775.1 unnamed protein product [Tuber melanosporum]
MHPSPFPQTSGSSSSQPVNFARGQMAPAASGINTGETDSWVEVASHPSDSAYTSSSDEHIITAGLQVSAARRRRRSTFRDVKPSHPQTGIAQESEDGPLENGEAEEEEEEEGEHMGSMINEMPMSSDGYSSPGDEEDDSDDEASASHDASAPRTVFSASSQPRPFQDRSHMVPTSRRHGPGGFNMFAPNHATDHDEALRASLSTLLSCAAAARGLTKSPPQSQAPGQAQTAPQQGGRVAVEGIRVVREDNLPSEASGSVGGRSRRGSVDSTADSTSSPPSPPNKLPSKDTEEARKKTRRPDKKSKSKTRSRSSRRQEASEGSDLTSTLGVSYATLAISAGAIVLLSAITFSAGYAMGREVGKSEGGLLGRITGSGSGRGKAVVRSLSRASGGGLRGAAGRGISMGGGIGSVTA